MDMTKNVKIFITIVSILIVGLVSSSAILVYSKNTEYLKLQELPKVSFMDLEGDEVVLELTDGKGLIIAFVNTDCMYCNAELDLFKKYYDEISTKYNVNIISSESEEKVEVRFLEYGIENFPSYRVFIDNNFEMDKTFKVNQVPTLFIYGNDGTLIKVLKGLSKIEKILALNNE